MEIEDMKARTVLDSRGRWTVEVELFMEGLWSRASVPAGKSRGKHEAVQLPAKKSLRRFPDLKERLVGRDFGDQGALDGYLVELAGADKGKFGVDLVLAVSEAFCRRTLVPRGLPTPMLNVLNGGLHAGNGLAVQEFMIVPVKFDTFRGKMEAAVEVYRSLEGLLANEYGPAATAVGDEGGFAPPVETTEEALSVLEEAIGEAGLGDSVRMALDCAASSYFHKGKYHIDGRELAPDEYLAHLSRLTSSFNLLSVEDPMHEGDFGGFADFLSKNHVTVVGDDLTVTQLDRVEKAAGGKAINAVLVKPNQVGTVTETLQVVEFCRQQGWQWVMSHRSGETTDHFIAELAAATESPFIKAGAPCRGERTAKYNELLRLEEAIE